MPLVLKSLGKYLTWQYLAVNIGLLLQPFEGSNANAMINTAQLFDLS